MKDSSNLPKSWCWCRLEDLCEVKHGYAFKSKHFGVSGPIVLTPGNFTEAGDLDFINKRVVRLSTEYGNEWVLKNGDLLVVMTDLSKQKKILGISLILNSPEVILHNQRIGLVIPHISDINRQYLCYSINRPSYKKYISDTATGSLISHTSPTKLLKGGIALPPLNEQHRIVAKIEELTTHSRRAREALKDIPALIEQFKQSVLAAAFRGDLTADWREKNPDVEPASKLLERIREDRRAQWEAAELEKMRAKGKEPKNGKWKDKYKEPQEFDVEYLPSIPDDWCWASMDEATTLITDGEHATPERSNEGIYLLSARNIQNGYLSLEKVDFVSEEVHTKLENRLKVQSGDVFLSCSGTVGRSCVVPEGFQCSLVRSVAVLRPALQMGEFMSLTLRSPQLQSQINKKKTQTAQSNLFQGRIRVLALPIAPLAEQIKIVEYISEAFEKVTLLEKEYSLIIEQSACLDQSILVKAFRGELVPQDPNDEPASVLLERIRAEREKLAPKKKSKRPRKSHDTKAASQMSLKDI